MDSKLELRIKWTNSEAFSVESSVDDEPWTTVLEIYENGYTIAMWPSITKVLETYWKEVLAEIGTSMKQSN